MWKREVDWGKSGNWFASGCFTVTMSGTISLNGCKEPTAGKGMQDTLRNKSSKRVLPEGLRFYLEPFMSDKPFLQKRIRQI